MRAGRKERGGIAEAGRESGAKGKAERLETEAKSPKGKEAKRSGGTGSKAKAERNGNEKPERKQRKEADRKEDAS